MTDMQIVSETVARGSLAPRRYSKASINALRQVRQWRTRKLAKFATSVVGCAPRARSSRRARTVASRATTSASSSDGDPEPEPRRSRRALVGGAP